MKLVVLAVVLLAALATAAPSSSYCAVERRCSTQSDCVPDLGSGFTSYCCNGVCVDSDALPSGNLGDKCATNLCSGSCGQFDCRNYRCERYESSQRGPGCTCFPGFSQCMGSNSMCDYQANRTDSLNKCVGSQLPAGAPCDTDAQCATSDCDAATKMCKPWPAPPSPPPVFTSACSISDYSCGAGKACVTYEVPGQTNRGCFSRRSAEAYCQANSDCVSGVCDTTGNGDPVCVDAFSKADGLNCTDFTHCESKNCVVQPNGIWSLCQERKYNLPVDAPCGEDAACLPGLKCIGSTGTKVCKSVVGRECRISTGDCGANAVCDCVGTVSRCTPSTVPRTSVCADEFVAYRSFTNTAASSAANVFIDFSKPWAWFPAPVAEATAKLACCRFRNGLSTVASLADTTTTQVSQSVRLNCREDPPVWEHLPVGDFPERCSAIDKIKVNDLFYL